MKKKTHRQILEELTRRPRVPAEVKEKNGDIEKAIVEAGGTAGSMANAHG